MKLYRFMSQEEFYKMQRGEDIIGLSNFENKNTNSKGICFFPENLTFKYINDNIEKKIENFNNEQILNLRDDYIYNFTVKNNILEMVTGIVSRDCIVEFEVDDDKILRLSDNKNLEERPQGKIIEGWGIYAKPYGGFSDKSLVFEFSIDKYNKDFIKPIKVASYNLFNVPSFSNEYRIEDSDYVPYTDTLKLNCDLFKDITNENLEEERHLLDLRENYSEIAIKLFKELKQFYDLREDNVCHHLETDDVTEECINRKFHYLMYRMKEDFGANIEDIRDVFCYSLDKMEEKPENYVRKISYLTDVLEDVFYSDKKLNSIWSNMASVNVNFYLCSKEEKEKSNYKESLISIVKDLIFYEKENGQDNYNKENIKDSILNSGIDIGFKMFSDDKIEETRNFISNIVDKTDLDLNNSNEILISNF